MEKWSKRGIAVSLTAVLTAGMLAGCGNSGAEGGNNGKLTQVTLNEVAHSMEYTDKSNTAKRLLIA